MAFADLQELLPRLAERDSRDPEIYPSENVAELRAARIPTMPFSKELGGEGASLVDAVRAIEAVASASPSTALLLAMPLGLAGIYGSAVTPPPEHTATWAFQRERMAADFAAGKLYAACNSERGAGGALDATKTLASKSDGSFRISGEKILASSGRNADYFFSTAKVAQEDLPGAGIVEFFFVPTAAQGVEILADWDGFGMRSTESQTVRYDSAAAEFMFGFPNFLATVQPLQYWFCLFAAIPLGCAAAVIRALGDPVPAGPAMRVRLSDAVMRYESLRAYLLETAARWRPGAGPEYAARVLRTKTYVSQESTRLCAELFALGGGRHYRRSGAVARAVADAFAGTALRPPLPLALETLAENFSLGPLATLND
ncbi:MAG: acyl-CoA dehydrogenase family protein [Tepidiformaceae bacterium]